MGAPRIVLSSICALVGLAACGDNAPRALRTISLDPGSPKLAAGIMLDVKASYVAADQSASEATEATDVTWAVDEATVATVMPGTGGHATLLGVNAGTTTLTVAGGGARGAFTVTVTPAVLTNVSIAPTDPSLAAGTSVQLTATGVFSDKTSINVTRMVTWKSSATGTASVDSDGLLHGAIAGTVAVSATLAKVTAIANVTVTSATLRSIGVTPIDPDLPLGIHQQFTATGVFSDDSTQDLTHQVTWSSDTEASATVDANGMVIAVARGTATIEATKSGISGTSRATVTPAVLATVVDIQLAPVNDSLAVGSTVSYTATGLLNDGTHQPLTDHATWTSSDPTIAGISDAPGSKGEARALRDGTVTIRAAFGGVTGSTPLTVMPAVLQSIAVTPADPQLPIGHTLGFTATGTFSDGPRDITTQVGWSVSPDGIATISNLSGAQGVATAAAAGTTTVTATFPGATPITGSTSLTVTAAELVSIDVTPETTNQVVGAMLQYTATGNYTDDSTQDLTTQVDWASDNMAVASIDPATGRAFAAAVGSATISATFTTTAGSVVGHATFHVMAAAR